MTAFAFENASRLSTYRYLQEGHPGYWELLLLTINEGSEDFPSGVVAKTDRLGFEGHCFVDPGFQFKLNLDLLRTRNLGNQPGENEDRFGLSLTAIYTFAN